MYRFASPYIEVDYVILGSYRTDLVKFSNKLAKIQHKILCHCCPCAYIQFRNERIQILDEYKSSLKMS